MSEEVINSGEFDFWVHKFSNFRKSFGDLFTYAGNNNEDLFFITMESRC